jgi:ABC-type proline/glycine betaine transport system ATPase subunit
MTTHETSALRYGDTERPLIEMRDIVKKYGDTVVLDRVDLEVRRGEVVVLIGPSGAGKSTLLRCINGLEQIQGGTITVGGDELVYQEKHLNRVRSRIGMVFQSFNLFPHRRRAGAPSSCSNAWGWRRKPRPIPTTSRAVSSSVSRSPGRSRWTPR